MSIEMDLLALHDPSRGPVPGEGRQELLRDLKNDAPRARRRNRGRVAVISACAGAVVAATGGLAFALLGQSPTSALKINCSAGVTQSEFDHDGGFTVVIDTTSGDPATDCANQYAANGEQPPALQAYDVGAPYVYVVPKSWKVPGTWRPLPPGFRSDTARLALKQHVEDPVDGPSAKCRNDAETRRLVGRYVDERGLTGWTVKNAPGWQPADGRRLCAFAFLDERGSDVVYVQAGPPYPPSGDAPEVAAYSRLRHALRDRIADRCLGLAEAKTEAESALTEARLKGTVSAAPEPAGPCAAVDLVTGGGQFQVLLY